MKFVSVVAVMPEDDYVNLADHFRDDVELGPAMSTLIEKNGWTVEMLCIGKLLSYITREGVWPEEGEDASEIIWLGQDYGCTIRWDGKRLWWVVEKDGAFEFSVPTQGSILADAREIQRRLDER